MTQWSRCESGVAGAGHYAPPSSGPPVSGTGGGHWRGVDCPPQVLAPMAPVDSVRTAAADWHHKAQTGSSTGTEDSTDWLPLQTIYQFEQS